MGHPRSTGPRQTLLKSALLAALAVLLLLPSQALAENAAPVRSNATLSPGGNFPSTGGTTTVSADVTDDVSVDIVFANVTGQDGSFQSVTMPPAGGDSYSATITFPTNFSDQPVGYQVDVEAIDGDHLDTIASAGEVQLDGLPPFD